MIYFDFHHHHFHKIGGIYNLDFEETPPNSFFSAGIHPNLSADFTGDHFKWLTETTKNKNCVAIGECGLDGLINIDDQLQQELFEKQIELANHRKKPLIIHCVKRFSQIIHLQKKAKVPMIIHGFNKRKSVGEDLQKHNFHLSFGKSVLQNVNLQEFVKDFPTEKLFLETDAENFDIKLLYQKVSELKNLNVKDLVQQIEENLKIFNISL